jgi:hypothetical protein
MTYDKQYQVVLARLFVGSVSAIVLYLGLSGGIVQVANVSGTSATVLLTVAFAAGYSERFAPPGDRAGVAALRRGGVALVEARRLNRRAGNGR